MPDSRTPPSPRPAGGSAGPGSTAAPGQSWWRRFAFPVLVVLIAVALVVAVQARDGGGAGSGATGSGAAQGSQGGAGAPTTQDNPAGQLVEPGAQSPAALERRDPADPLAIGPVDAPVVLIAYSDYQCPFCALWVEQTEPLMMDLVESGDLRIEWRDVNVFGPDSERAAQAAYAAGLQGMFQEYHHLLFAGGEKRSPDQLSEDALVGLAADLGLDVDQFTTDLRSPEVAAQVQRNEDDGLSIGAYSTPTFVVGGVVVVGAQPAEVFLQAVQDELTRLES